MYSLMLGCITMRKISLFLPPCISSNKSVCFNLLSYVLIFILISKLYRVFLETLCFKLTHTVFDNAIKEYID